MEQEYTLKQYCIYVLRRWIIIAAAVVVALAVGIASAVVKKPDYTVEMYEGYIDFDLEQYVNYKTDGGGITIEGDQAIYASSVSSMVQLVVDSSVESAVYDLMKDGYKNTGATTAEKIRGEFFDNLKVFSSGYRATARFAYRIKNDADREYAKSVIVAYRTLALLKVNEKYDIDPTKSYSNFISSSDAYINHNTAELDWVEEVKNTSVVTAAVLGAVIGAVLGVVVTLVLYVSDKRIKSVRVILPEDKATVLYAGKGELNEDAAIRLASRLVSDKTGSVLVATVSPDGSADCLAGFLRDKLAALGAEGVKVETYENKGNGELALVCGGYVSVCLVADQSSASAEQLIRAVSDVSESKAEYLGVVLYNVGASYLD